MTRALVYHLAAETSALSDYVPYCLNALRDRYDTILVAVDGDLDEEAATALAACCDLTLEVEEKASAFTAYRAGLERLGWDAVADFDELTVMSSTLFGPVFPVEDMFAAMDAEFEGDAWALAEAKPREPDDAPAYLKSDMITFRKRLLASDDFKAYWADMPPLQTKPEDTSAEARKAQYLIEKGYTSGAFLSVSDSMTHEPLYLEMQTAIKTKRIPFLSFEPFCRSPNFLDDLPADINQVLPILKKRSDFPEGLFWTGALRKASLRTLHTNLAYQFTFDSDAYGLEPKWDDSLRIAVCAHVYYPDVLPEILERAKNIPLAFDLFITTATEENKAVIEAECAKEDLNADVRVVGQNRGRDMASLYIDLKDVVLDGGYDLICRLHSKRSPQVNASTGTYFKHFIFDSVLASKEYTSHLLDFLVTHPHVGMAFAPLIHTGYATMGHAWYSNYPAFKEIMDDLGYETPRENYSPIAAFGTVYWFRPDALRPMFEDQYKYDQYNKEPNHVDGGLAHGQERAMTYIAQARGYMSATVWPDYVAAQASTLMEYKMDSLYSHLPPSRIAPHYNLLSFMSSKRSSLFFFLPRVAKTPTVLKDFEKRHRSKVKKLGKALGVKRNRRV